MPGTDLIQRVPKLFLQELTFTGATGEPGDTGGAYTVATVTGQVLITHLSAFCTTLLAGGSATVELGTANNTAELIAQTTATDIDANEFWLSATPEVEATNAIVNKLVGADIILTTATADVTAGVIKVAMLWTPLSEGGNLG